MSKLAMDKVAEFNKYRKLLLSIAYNILGTKDDAEDIVQETYIRFNAYNKEVSNPKSFLTTITSNLSIDLLRKEPYKKDYIGPWLPEPIYTDQLETDPIDEVTLPYAILVLIEQLPPQDRAIYVLRKAFNVSYKEIATIVDMPEENCRKVYSRIKNSIKTDINPDLPTKERKQFIKHFTNCVAENRLDDLIKLLSDDIKLYADSNGKVRGAAIQVLQGSENILKFVTGTYQKTEKATEQRSFMLIEINGEPAITTTNALGERIIIHFHTKNGLCNRINIIANPDKLKNISI